MSIEKIIQTTLQNSAEVSSLLTGGIYTIQDTGRTGLTFTSTPQAFNGPSILPCAMVKERRRYFNQQIRDQGEQVASFHQAVEIRLYQDNGLDVIQEALKAIYKVLHDKRIDNTMFTIVAVRQGRWAEELNGAIEIVIDVDAQGLEKPGE